MIKWFTKIKKKLAILLSSEITEESLDSMLDFVASCHKKQDRIKNKTIFMYPAELSKCLKVLYYKYVDDIPIVTGLGGSALIGNILDVGIKQLIKKFQKTYGKIYLIEDFPVHHSFKIGDWTVVISGTIDFVAKNAIIEIKTVSRIREKPLEADIYQAGFYAKKLSLDYNRSFEAYLVYVQKYYYNKKIYKLSQQEIEKGFREILDRAIKLFRAIYIEKYPPKPSPGFWCTGCPLLKECEEGQAFIRNIGRDPKEYIEAYRRLYDKITNFAKGFNIDL